MDEADILGDRIAMISAGRLRCCGSGLFLKKKYGSGLHLTLVIGQPAEVEGMSNNSAAALESNEVDDNDSVFKLPSKSEVKSGLNIPSKLTPASSKSKLNVEPIQHFIRKEAPKSVLVGQAGSEVTYTVPYENPEFLSLFFAKLDQSLSNMGVSSYGVSDTTLEEV